MILAMINTIKSNKIDGKNVGDYDKIVDWRGV